MVDWPSTLLSGLAGAVIALLGAFGLQSLQNKRDDTAACRATYMEVAANSSAFRLMDQLGVTMPISAATWHETRTRLAGMLSVSDFVELAAFYIRVDALPQTPPSGWGGTLTPQQRATMAEAGRRGMKVLTILENRGWGARERKAVAKQIAIEMADEEATSTST